MPKAIHKYPIWIQDKISLSLPIDAQILSVQFQHGTPVVWALINPMNPLTTRNLIIIGTGNPIHQDLSTAVYLATIQDPNTGMVWHVFDEYVPSMMSTLQIVKADRPD